MPLLQSHISLLIFASSGMESESTRNQVTETHVDQEHSGVTHQNDGPDNIYMADSTQGILRYWYLFTMNEGHYF